MGFSCAMLEQLVLFWFAWDILVQDLRFVFLYVVAGGSSTSDGSMP